jgi:dihydrofolate synthase/folylpolyglutamate synthase
MEYINSFSKSGKPVKDLSRIKRLLALLGNPQDSLQYIHVAGTNGKGSTVEMLSNALILSNYRVGSFTSPYMLCYEDRIRFNGENIPQNELCDIATTVRRSVLGNEYSQFEITMAIAMLYFKRMACDIVVLETGIGGAVDSTNVIKSPLVSVITSISLDHTAILGDTLTKIATQKAGIIKPNCPVVLSCDNTNPEVIAVVSKVAEENNSQLVMPTTAQSISVSIHGEEFTYLGTNYTTKMLGRHQVSNAITVIEVCRLLNGLGYNVPTDCVKRSLESTQVTFRTQTFNYGGVTIVADGSHNVGGVTALKDTLNACGIVDPVVLTGMISTKDYTTCCQLLDSISNTVVCTDGYIYNAVPSLELAKLFTHNVTTCELSHALEYALSIAKERDSVLVVCGSLYLLTEVLKQV